MPSLELVRAGAGSGKTYDLCQTVFEAVSSGLDPARLLATTYTNKAAAELKGRIQSRLLAANGDRNRPHEKAERLDLAAIGTVHSVAHQLLSRYAIDLGLSPRLEVITDATGHRALSSLLGNTPSSSLQPLSACADRLGITDIPDRILELLSARRGNAIADEDFLAQMSSSAERVCDLLSPVGADTETSPASQLQSLAAKALADINALTEDTQNNTNTARQQLRRLTSQQLPLWASHVFAMGIKAGITSGADAMLDPLRNHAAQVRQSPGLHTDIRDFSQLLAMETIRLDSQYTEYKTARGLLDFTDLEILLLRLLQNPTLAGRLAGEFDLVLVDEFQDTNPLQLAIFQQLQQLSPRSRWVGDPKQAIYGFRDTDPELVDEIWNNAPAETLVQLPDNYRSQRGLVQFVGSVFEPVFGDNARQGPIRQGAPRGIERWIFDTKNQPDDATALACGIARLKQEGIRAGDIVILERLNRMLPPLARALDRLGIPCLYESPGLLSTREGAVTLAGLRLVADRMDSLAAATVLHLLSNPQETTPDWVRQRLQAVRNRTDNPGTKAGSGSKTIPWSGDPLFSTLEQIDRRLLSPVLIVQQVIESLDLTTSVRSWSDPARRCSNLDSFLRHAQEYEDLASDSCRPATLTGLILYLEQLHTDELDLCYPPQGHDAVTLLTYHSAKGLEWPVVVLSGLNCDRAADMWSPVVTGGGQREQSPLQNRTVRSWVWPFGNTGDRSGLGADALASPEGQERTLRQKKEHLRLLYVGCTRAQQKLVFAHRDGKDTWLQQLSAVDELLDISLDDGEHELDGMDTTFVLRHLNTGMTDESHFETSSRERWMSSTAEVSSAVYAARFHSPSLAPPCSDDAGIVTEELPGGSCFPAASGGNQSAAIGDAVHSYLAALPSLRSVDNDQKERVAARCLSGFSVSGPLSASVLAASGERFLRWVETRYPQARWHVETPACGPREAGGHWNGTIDLVLQLPNGKVVVIDHKSTALERHLCPVRASHFTGKTG